MKVKVVMGDWSHDGHGIAETHIVELATVCGQEELNDFYNKGVKIIGFDMTKEVAENYEENSIKEQDYARLINLGYVPYQHKGAEGKWDELPYKSEDGDVYYIDSMIYLDMYMFFVALGYEQVVGSAESFKYYIVSDDMPSVKIGGYGLFYN